MLIAGGGGGGGRYYGGGGGAGGMLEDASLSLLSGATYNVTIGAVEVAAVLTLLAAAEMLVNLQVLLLIKLL